MAATEYTYSIAGDTANAALGSNLHNEIATSAIVTALDYVTSADDALSVLMKGSLSAGDETILDAVVAAHAGAIAEIDAPTDPDMAPLTRVKQASQGWTFQARFMRFETSVLASVVNDKEDGTAWGDATIKFYDASDVELTVQGDLDTDCVKTVFDWEADHDIEIIGGSVCALIKPTVDVDVWCVAVPDIPAGSGGSKVMINQLNLYYTVAGAFGIDGRASKRMNYNATYHTNKFRKIIKHPAGEKVKLQVEFEHFKV